MLIYWFLKAVFSSKIAQMGLICAIFEGASLGCIIFASFFRRHNALNGTG